MSEDEVMTTPPVMVSIQGVGKAFGSVRVLENVSFDVPTDQVVCVLGPSGSGKSTLLRCINMLERPDRGKIYVDGELVGYRRRGAAFHELSGRALARKRQDIGMVFQMFELFENATVLQNVMAGPVHVLKEDPKRAKARAMDLLDRVGVADKAKSYPSTLSGGQKQRVAISRAMAMRPRVMLFDEPTSALDPEFVNEVLGVIENVVDGMTSIIVTHEIDFARRIADHVIFMADGWVVEQGPPEQVLLAPREPRTRAFLSGVSSSPRPSTNGAPDGESASH